MAVQYGLWNKENKEFARHYGLYYDEDVCAILMALSEEEFETLLDGSDTLRAAEPQKGLQLYTWDSILDAELDRVERHFSDQYEVREIPADEPEWELF